MWTSSKGVKLGIKPKFARQILSPTEKFNLKKNKIIGQQFER
jgi:hypothetical protein